MTPDDFASLMALLDYGFKATLGLTFAVIVAVTFKG